jgi:hypothetical protein
MLIDLDDGHLQMRSKIADSYKLISRPKSEDELNYYFIRKYKQVTEDMTYSED